MAYVFDYINNTLIDDEDKSLGNKLAVLDSDLEKVLQELNEKFGPGTIQEGTQGIPQPEIKTPQAIFEFEERMKGRMADGGRADFADNPLKNFNFTVDNIPEGYKPASELAEKLGVSYDTLKSYKTLYGKGQSPTYERILNTIGEPIQVTGFKDAFGGGASYLDYFDLSKLDDEALKTIKERKTMPDRGGAGVQVLSDENLKQKFIDAYNKGYGGRDIMSVIDPDNTLNVNQEKYGSRVLTELIKNKEITLRSEGERTKSQEAYFEKNRAPIDLEIEKINKFYKPGMTLETVTKKLYPDFTPIKDGDNLSVIDKKTEQLKNASTRLIDYKAWLKGDRPDSAILDNLNLPKNKQKIIKFIEGGQDSKFKRFGGLRERQYKFYKLDKLNKKPFGYYDGLNKKLYQLLKNQNLNYQIEHGGSISQSLKKKIPWVGKFITFMKPKYNAQKIPLDMDTGILKAYDVLENKNLSTKQKKSHPDVISHNKAAKNFMQKTGIKVPIISFDKKDVNKIIERDDVDPQTKRQVKNTFDKNGWTLINPGDQIEEVIKFVKDNGKDIPKNRKQIIIQGFRNTISNLFKDAPIPKTVKLPIGATAASLDFMIFNGFLGIPAPEAALGSAQWLLKNPEAAQKIGMAINAVVDGKMTLNEFFDKNSNELGGVFKDLIGIDLPDPYSKDDEVGKERLKEMDQAMEVPKLDKTTAAPLYDFANGGRAGFSNGGAAGADENFLKELEFYFTNEDAELPKMQTYKETMNPIEVLNDIIDPRNYPYYADVLARSGVRIAEFAGRILPATGKLIADIVQKGPFRITGGSGNNYVQDYEDVLPSNIRGTGIFSEFLQNITPTTLEKKIGLDKLIKAEEQKQIDRGSTAGPKVLADTIGLGAEVTAPIFPGLKLLNAFAKAKNLPNDKVTQKILEKEVDKVLSEKGMNRREFLQATGATATVVMAKMLGLMDVAPKVSKVTRTAPIMDNTVEGMPAWFKDAVYVIERKGILKSRGDIKGIEPDFFEITLDTKLGKKKVLMSKNDRDGEITLDWTTSYYDMELPVTITYRPGQSGKQNFLSDPEFSQSVEKYDVEVEAPEFEYKTVDTSSMGAEDTNFDSALNLDIKEEADAVVEALEDLALGLTKKEKKSAAENFRYYNEVELDESSVGPDTANPIDESDAFPFLDMIKRNKDK